MESFARGCLTAAALTLVVGCSDGGKASPSPTSNVPIASVASIPPDPPTTPSASTTTTTMAIEPTTTDAEPTTTTVIPEPTTEPETTLPDGVPPRLTFPDDPDKQAVVDAVYAFVDAADAVAANPSDYDLRSAFLATVSPPLEGRFIGFLDELVANDEYIESRPQTYVEVLEFTVDTFGSGGTLDVCAVSANVRRRYGKAGAQDAIIDDGVSSALQTYTLAFVDGEWTVTDIERYARFEGQLGCT